MRIRPSLIEKPSHIFSLCMHVARLFWGPFGHTAVELGAVLCAPFTIYCKFRTWNSTHVFNEIEVVKWTSITVYSTLSVRKFRCLWIDLGLYAFPPKWKLILYIEVHIKQNDSFFQTVITLLKVVCYKKQAHDGHKCYILSLSLGTFLIKHIWHEYMAH